MIKVVYSCNDELFDGLYLSMLSILRRTKETVAFYLLTADFIDVNPHYTKLTKEHNKILTDLVTSYNPNNKFVLIDCKKEYERELGNNKNESARCSTYTLLRLLVDCYPFFNDKVIYLDVDTMACGDIKELYSFDVGENEFLAAHNRRAVRWYQKRNYFNAGVLLFNMKQIRKTNLFKKARKILFKKKLLNSDQQALFYAATKYSFFPGDDYRFNRQTTKIRPDDVIKHFNERVVGWPRHNNIKQWHVKSVHRHLHIYNFDEDYKQFFKMKKKVEEKLKNEFYISVSHLRKSYNNIKAVDDISFNVKKGSLFAFLGVNGAGKSTTINIISSILAKDSGDIKIDGYDLVKDNSKVKEEIGIVFQNSSLDGLLTVKENLIIRARFYRYKKEAINKAVNRVTSILNLGPILNQPVEKLSGGQKRRVDIARALIHEPKLLMLDEPTTGLDPKTRLDVWHLIDEVRQRTKMTVFLTTHYLEEAEKASYVVIMDKGKIIAEGTPNELKNNFSTDTLVAYQKKNSAFEKNVKGYKYIYDSDALAYRIAIKDSDDAKKLLDKYAKYIPDFEVEKGDMNSVFLNVIGGKKK